MNQNLFFFMSLFLFCWLYLVGGGGFFVVVQLTFHECEENKNAIEKIAILFSNVWKLDD